MISRDLILVDTRSHNLSDLNVAPDAVVVARQNGLSIHDLLHIDAVICFTEKTANYVNAMSNSIFMNNLLYGTPVHPRVKQIHLLDKKTNSVILHGW